MPNQIVITSLEEDMRKIGLLPKEEKPVVAEEPKEKPAEEPKAKVEGQQTPETTPEVTDEMSEEEAKLYSQLEGFEKVIETTELSEGQLTEVAKIMKRLHRGTSRARMMSKKWYRKNRSKIKAFNRKAVVKRIKKKHAKISKMFRKGRKMPKRRMSFTKVGSGKRSLPPLKTPTPKGKPGIEKVHGAKHEGLDRVAELVNECRAIAEGAPVAEGPSFEEASKTFANVAIISEMLANAFISFGAELDEAVEFEPSAPEMAEDMEDLSELFSEIAEATSICANMLHEGQEPESGEDIVAFMQESMDVMLDGLDIYSAVIEGDEDDDEDMDACDEKCAKCEKCEADCECDKGKSKTEKKGNPTK